MTLLPAGEEFEWADSHTLPESGAIEYKSPSLPNNHGDSESEQFQRQFTVALSVPRDGRIRLAFDLVWLNEFECASDLSGGQFSFSDSLQRLQRFGQTMENCGALFYMLDYGLTSADPILVIYRPRNLYIDMVPDKRDEEEECTPEWLTRHGFFVPDERTADTRVAPWGRILYVISLQTLWAVLATALMLNRFCQGLSLVPDSERQLDRPFASLPYLLVDDDGTGRNRIHEILRLHLACCRGGGSEIGNPYEDLHCGFHVTFYEMIRTEPSHEGWKTGFLYESQGHARQYFRQSAFSILTTARDMSTMSESKPERTETAYWTILLLTPSDFFARPRYPSRDIDWAEVGKYCYGRTAEMACIVSGLRQVVERWIGLHEYIDRLLSEGDFMDPRNYARLLFDDNMDERSRRYFWIIGCLDEFDRSIEDNMKQWKLYQAARAPRSQFKDSKKKPRPEALRLEASLGSAEYCRFWDLVKQGDNLHEQLRRVQSMFQNQRTTAQRVRDGLFNASALMESRASTRLGHNVALLTYVSIFYLPLAFCAALWAIPNITDSSTRNAFAAASVVVGFFTYTIVFNLENIVKFLGAKYHAYRSGVVDQMLRDSSAWQERGRNLQESQPSTNRNVSSEWWILLYRMRVLMEKLRAFVRWGSRQSPEVVP